MPKWRLSVILGLVVLISVGSANLALAKPVDRGHAAIGSPNFGSEAPGTAAYPAPVGTGNAATKTDIEFLENSPQVEALQPTPAGTVRVNNLANLEALLNIIANGTEIMGIANGIPMMLLGFVLLALPDRRKLAAVFIPLGFVLAVVGLATPGIVNWLVASARDAGVFN